MLLKTMQSLESSPNFKGDHKRFFKAFLLLSFFVFMSFSTIQAQSKKEQRLQKKMEKLEQPKWLKIKNGKGYFKDDKNSYVKRVALEANEQNTGRLVSEGSDFYVNKSGYDYERLEKKIIQVALFVPEVRELEIEVVATCKENYRDVQFLFIYEYDLERLRNTNQKENFLKNYIVTDPQVFSRLQLVTENLCK
jgi:hypothetical protein